MHREIPDHILEMLEAQSDESLQLFCIFAEAMDDLKIDNGDALYTAVVLRKYIGWLIENQEEEKPKRSELTTSTIHDFIGGGNNEVRADTT